MTPATESWSYSEGTSPHKVTAYENVDRKGTLYLRWREERAGKERNWQLKSLKKGLRTAGGRIILAVKKWAIEEAKRQHLTLVRGASPAERPKVLLRLGETEARLINPHTGLYPRDTPHRREVLRALRYAIEVWGTDTAWAAIQRAQIRELWRRRLETLKSDGHVGARGAEVVIARILAIAAWLRDEELIPVEACLVPRKWKAGIREEAGDPEPRRPRYTPEESKALIRMAPAVDPRNGLLVALGAELRLGQVVRALRTDLDTKVWTFRVRGRGKKRGTLIELTPGQIVSVQRALNGYLRHLEATQPDYPLFPSGKLVGAKSGEGVAKDQHAARAPVNRRTIGEWWKKTEQRCGIPHVPGRLTYGVRRSAVDGALAEGISLEALQNSGGWSDVQIPQNIYRDRELKSAASEAMKVRAKVRGEDEEIAPNP